AVLASVVWLAVSLGFKYYVTRFGTYTATYGTIGGVMVLLLWFYLSGVVLLAGAEMNAEIEHASPYGKAGGGSVPGTERALGALASRRFLAQPPLPRPMAADLPVASPAPAPSVLRRALVAAVAAFIVFRDGGS